MSEERIRRRVAFEAARLIYVQEEKGHFQAKRKAVRRFRGDELHLGHLPSNREIRKQIQAVVEALDTQKQNSQSGEQLVYDGELLPQTDRFRIFELLLLPLENVKEDLQIHPEGDALYHSLQVFELARNALPYDEEFMLSALLHDVGKAIDPRDHIASGLEALDGSISPRTVWLIEHHTEALSLRNGTLGARSRRRLEAAESFDELMLLAECDRQGRAVGAVVPDVPEALAYLRDLAETYGE